MRTPGHAWTASFGRMGRGFLSGFHPPSRTLLEAFWNVGNGQVPNGSGDAATFPLVYLGLADCAFLDWLLHRTVIDACYVGIFVFRLKVGWLYWCRSRATQWAIGNCMYRSRKSREWCLAIVIGQCCKSQVLITPITWCFLFSGTIIDSCTFLSRQFVCVLSYIIPPS